MTLPQKRTFGIWNIVSCECYLNSNINAYCGIRELRASQIRKVGREDARRSRNLCDRRWFGYRSCHCYRTCYIKWLGSTLPTNLLKEFAKSGSNLFLTDINADNLNEVRNIIASLKLGVSVVTRVIDVTSEEHVNQSFIDCIVEFGG